MPGIKLPTPKDQKAFLEVCRSFKYLAVDTEGYAPNILGISVAHPALESMYFPIGHRESVNVSGDIHDLLRQVLAEVPYRIFHNAGHDLTALPYLFDLPFFDTMIGGHMVDENVMSKSLDWMVKYYCPGEEGKQRPAVMQSIIDTWGWYQVPYALVYGYAAQDALITMKLFLKLLPLYIEQFGELWTPSSKS
jgi:DNA polymerase I-like protein with 3'-5' exonuclease and polymerase domains